MNNKSLKKIDEENNFGLFNPKQHKLIKEKQELLNVIKNAELTSFTKQYILDSQLCSAAVHGNIKQIIILLKNGADIHARTCNPPPIYLAAKFKRYKIIKYLKLRKAHFGSVQTTGTFAGFTALHFACLEGNLQLVKSLVEKYKVDLTAVADDGAQPIHIAALCGFPKIVIFILRAGANILTELSYSLYEKYGKNSHWRDNLGNKVPLVIFILINHGFGDSTCVDYISNCIISYNKIINVKDKNNKTFVMYFAEYLCSNKSFMNITVGAWFDHCFADEFNKRDNDDFTVFHHLLDTRFEEYKYHPRRVEHDHDIVRCHLNEIQTEINTNVMANNDPRTLPIHMAAYRGYELTLMNLLNEQTFFTSSGRPLFYALQNYEKNSTQVDQSHMPLVDPHTIKIVHSIIMDIRKRQLFKYPVHEEEVKLMNYLVEKESSIKKFVESVDKYLEDMIPNMKKIRYILGDKEMSMYEALTAFNIINAGKEPWYQLVTKDQEESDEVLTFDNMIKSRLVALRRRNKLLKQLKNISIFIIKSLFLPFDIVWYITKYLLNEDLENFIRAYEPKFFVPTMC